MKQYSPVNLEEVTTVGKPLWPPTKQDIEEALDSIYDNLPPEAEADDFLWRTHVGDYIYVSAMHTEHLYNAFRMLFNHGVSPAFRVGAFVRHNDVFGWDRDYKEEAYTAMHTELQKRKDELSQDQKDELEDIRQNAEAFHILLQHEDPKSPLVGEPYGLD